MKSKILFLIIIITTLFQPLQASSPAILFRYFQMLARTPTSAKNNLNNPISLNSIIDSNVLKYKNDSTLFNYLISLVHEIKFENLIKRTDQSEFKYLTPETTKDITIGLTSNSFNKMDEFKRIFLKINLKPRLIPSIINVYDVKKKVNFTFYKSDNVIFDTAEFINFSISVKSKMSLFNNRIIVLVITINTGIGMKGDDMFLVSFHPNGSVIDCIEWLDSHCGESSIEPKVDSKKYFHFRCTECESSFYKDEFKVQKEYILDYSVRINEKGKFLLSNYKLRSVSMKNN